MTRYVLVLGGTGVLLLAAAWALLTPLGAVPDEATHMIRAAALYQGDVVGDRFTHTDPGPPPVEAVMFAVDVPDGFGPLPQRGGCWAGTAGGSAACDPPLGEGPGLRGMATIAGAYPPLPHALYGVLTRVATPTEAMYGGRLLGAAVSAALVAAGLALAWASGGRRLLVISLLALTPVAVWLFGSANPSGLEVAAGFSLWVAGLALLQDPRRTSAGVVLAASATAVAWSRPLGPAMAVGILAASAALHLDADAARRLRAAATARRALLAAALGVGTAAIWVVATDALSTFIARPDPALTPGVATAGSWAETPNRLRQMVGFFGLLETPAPPLVWNAWGMAVLVVLLAALWCGTARQRTVVLLLVGGTLGLPVLAEALTAAELGYTWQGRYTMPVATGVVVVSGWVLAHPRRDLPGPVLAAGGWAIALVAVGAHVLAPLAVTARFARGRGSGLLGWFDAAPWSPPGPDGLWLVLAAGGALVLLAVVALARPAGPPIPRAAGTVLPEP